MSRFLFRIIVKLRHNRSLLTQEYLTYDGRIRTYGSLEDHFQNFMEYVEKYPNDPRVKELRTMSREFELLGIPCGKEFIIRVYGKTVINSFRFCNGIIMCLRCSVFNHSCEPNAVPVFRLNSITRAYECRIIAKRAIREDEEVCLSYINRHLSVRSRRKILEENYFFDCFCPKCIRELQYDDKSIQEEEVSNNVHMPPQIPSAPWLSRG